jgi:hypothetical protein
VQPNGLEIEIMSPRLGRSKEFHVKIGRHGVFIGLLGGDLGAHPQAGNMVSTVPFGSQDLKILGVGIASAQPSHPSLLRRYRTLERSEPKDA